MTETHCDCFAIDAGGAMSTSYGSALFDKFKGRLNVCFVLIVYTKSVDEQGIFIRGDSEARH